MTKGTACYCVNPNCLERHNYFSYRQKECRSCNTPLVIQPHNILLKKPLHGFQENTNSEIFLIENLNIDSVDYPQIVKILRPDSGAIALRLFQQEGFLLQQLQGQAVPRVEPNPHFILAIQQDNGQQQNLHCLVMEHIIGESLEQKITAHPLPINIALDWLQQIAKILTAIHQQHIMHRDIKPSNIMVRFSDQEALEYSHGELILIDFGTAKKLTAHEIENSKANPPNSKSSPSTRIFSPGYTAPEQIQGNATMQSDLYAVGRTFMALLTGINPDAVDYETLHWQEIIPHSALRQLLLSLTALNPKERLPDAPTFLQHITKIIALEQTSPLQVWLKHHRQQLAKGGAIAISSIGLLTLSFKPICQKIADYTYREGWTLFTAIIDTGAPYDLEPAKNWYQWSLWFDPKHIGSHMGIGYVCDVQGDFDCAMTSYDKVIQYSLNHQSSVYIKATNNKSLLEIKYGGDIEQSILNLEKILPDANSLGLAGFIYKNLAWGHLILHDLAEGESWLTMAEKEIPDNPDVKCLKQAIEVARVTQSLPDVSPCSNFSIVQ
jgi:serine/threonine protein kinase